MSFAGGYEVFHVKRTCVLFHVKHWVIANVFGTRFLPRDRETRPQLRATGRGPWISIAEHPVPRSGAWFMRAPAKPSNRSV